MKKQMFILIPNLGGGGAERVIMTIAHHLSRDLWEITLIVVQDENPVYRSSIPNDISYINLRSSRVRYALPKLLSILWRRQPDVVFSTLGHLNLALAIVRRVLPKKVFFVARESSIVSYMNKHHRHPRIISWLYREFYSNLDFVVTQSRLMASDLVNNFNVPKNKIIVINNPVDIPRIKRLSKLPAVNNEKTREWHQYAGVKLLAVGRMSPEKGFDILIRSISLCRNLPIKLLILGSGKLYNELLEMVDRLRVHNIIILHEFIENPFPLMAAADGLVLSSHFEGFPNSVLEAATLGTPIISTPAPGGLADIIENINGCYVSSSINSGSLADAINAWYWSGRNRLSENCTSNFNAPIIVKHYEAVFAECLNHGR